MQDLVTYLVKNITGSDNIHVVESKVEDRTDLAIKAPKDIIGLIIGKGGNTIKNIRRVVKIKASLEGVYVNVFVEEASEN